MKKNIITLVAISLSLSGCGIYTKYEPATVVPDDLYGGEVVTEDTAGLGNMDWRELFTDPYLQSLIEVGLQTNTDYQSAQLRVEEAQAVLMSAKLAFLPAFALAPQGTVSSFDTQKATQTYSLPVTASWELDVFGRMRNSKKQAKALYAQSEDYRQAVRTQLIAGIANTYYTLLMLDEQLDISRQTEEAWKETVASTRALMNAGPITDEEHKANVRKGIAHCMRGDVFQIVLSRRFIQPYAGDDFKVYRALRSINPSPYLFYFDFGGYRIFGSSPETHCKIENGRAYIDPIAGTTRRTGDTVKDRELTEALLADPKENAEHVMLVDLARNDLSRNCHDVRVVFYKEPQYYSHVIHLVSRVSGMLNEGADKIKTFIDTFPAGTLSGAPKVRAMQLISEIEPHNRGAYGGCIGFIGLNGELNQAITIRTFVSRNNELWFQAGGGIVARSQDEYELQEVNNKLGALKKAIDLAVKLKN